VFDPENRRFDHH
jgi:uncharacterized UPF0160 family protein